MILAGGSGRRLGGRDKGMVMLGERPLIAWVIAALRPQVGTILISANRHLDEYARFGYPVITDADPEARLGPLAGIQSALRVIDTPWLLTLPCDTPCPPPELRARLAESVHEAQAELAIVHDGERDQPAHALLPAQLAGDLDATLARGERSIRSWLHRHRLARADFSDQPDAFLNINTAADLSRVERALEVAHSAPI